ncbi:ORF6C domain-containing protein [Moraxella bovis]|uniref:BRO family protein n=1 Tax=Moraxella bovis TaxID=476 RepID=UPI000993E9CE|nr:BRO family protein [Moraxella bovis]AWY19947.1 hypothetical protein DQF64_05185 [Moraxella bovis]UZA15740.1 ORF6C domain-containing protein [Moraxella bovis]
MSSLINFDFQSQTVRVELKNGEPLFCLTDVATILDISNANPSRFNLDEAGVHKMYISYESGKKQVTFINEPNLYRVIFRSNKAEAVKFQNWVFDEVLPSIRKTGQYRHTISTEQQAQIQKCVRQKCLHNSTHYQTVYTALKDKFGVPSYKDILASDFENAMAFIMGFEFAPALNIPLIQNVLADNAFQNKKAQDELSQMMAYFSGALDHLAELKHRLEISERCIMALQNRFIA